MPKEEIFSFAEVVSFVLEAFCFKICETIFFSDMRAFTGVVHWVSASEIRAIWTEIKSFEVQTQDAIFWIRVKST